MPRWGSILLAIVAAVGLAALAARVSRNVTPIVEERPAPPLAAEAPATPREREPTGGIGARSSTPGPSLLVAPLPPSASDAPDLRSTETVEASHDSGPVSPGSEPVARHAADAELRGGGVQGGITDGGAETGSVDPGVAGPATTDLAGFSSASHAQRAGLVDPVGQADAVSTGHGAARPDPGDGTDSGAAAGPETRRPKPLDAPESIPSVRMECTTPEVAVGDAVSIQILLDDGVDVKSVPFHVAYDPAVLRFEDGDEGPFLAGGGRPTAFFAAPTSAGDTVVVGLSQLGQGEGIAGSGELCVLHFTAVGPGPAALEFRSAKVRGGESRILPASFVAAPLVVR